MSIAFRYEFDLSTAKNRPKGCEQEVPNIHQAGFITPFR